MQSFYVDAVDRQVPCPSWNLKPVPRLKILSGAEQMLFDHPPHLSAAERRQIFELPAAVWSAAGEIEPLSNRVGFLVAAAYISG